MDWAALFEQVSQFFKNNKDMLTLLAGGVAGTFALTRYWSDQKWAKKQFAYDYAQRVFDDPKAMSALHMLDWSNGEFPDAIAAEYKLKPTELTWDQSIVVGALRVHDLNPEGEQFDAREWAIRELFDACLAHFERLGHFVESGVLSAKDFPTTLAYYIRLMDEARMTEVWGPLHRYMKRYGFDDACRLFDRLLKEQKRAARTIGA